MSYEEVLGQQVIAISISESPNMPALGLSDGHLRDAMAEIARHLLALGARLVYGGDLREHGFSKLLFELVSRHHRDSTESDNRTDVINFLAWPVHIAQSSNSVAMAAADLEGAAELVLLQLNGARLPIQDRPKLGQQQPTETDWSDGLTAMRRTMLEETSARIVLGGRVDKYKGSMPGIAEEALMSLRGAQPLYLIGGYGGCTRDIAEAMGLVQPVLMSHLAWPRRNEFKQFSSSDLRNGLSVQENKTLAMTPHVDQAVMLILRGLMNVVQTRS